MPPGPYSASPASLSLCFSFSTYSASSFTKIYDFVEKSAQVNGIPFNTNAEKAAAIDAYIKEHDDFEIVNYYIDNEYSGANFDRPEFVQLCFDIAKKKINCVIVKDLSRFGLV